MNPPTTLTNHNPPATIGCGLNPNPIRREESDTPQSADPAPRATPTTSAACNAARPNAKRPEHSNDASQTASGHTSNTTSNTRIRPRA